MLKLVVVADGPAEERTLLRAAHGMAAVLPDARVHLAGAHLGRDAAQRLDGVLFERPLAELLVVVGRASSTAGHHLSYLYEVLIEHPELAAVTTGADLGPSIDDVVAYGGAFRAGPLCQAGGFVGDGHLSIHDRLERLGFRSAVLSDEVPCDAMIGRPWPLPA